jgi:hypothetical protein
MVFWRQTAVHAENLLVDHCSQREAVEAVCEGLPKSDVIPTLALVVEAVNAIDGGTLVVAAQEKEVFGKFDFICEEKTDSF